MTTSFSQLWLACKDRKQADQIANTLLAGHLITCAKQIPITSQFKWKGSIKKSEETLLIMDSREDLFESIEKEVKKLHSYDTFVLESISVTKVSSKAKRWMVNELSINE